MEQSRLIIAIALSFLVFILWNFLFVENQQVGQPEQDVSEKAKENIDIQTSDTEPIADIVDNGYIATGIKEEIEKPHRDTRIITINTPIYTATISEDGAVLKNLTLNEYWETSASDSKPKELITPENLLGNVRVGLYRNSFPEIENAFFTADLDSNFLDVNTRPKKITFSWTSPKGLKVEKLFTFLPDTYTIDFTIVLTNHSEQSIVDNLTISLIDRLPEKSGGYGFQGPCAFINNTLEQIPFKDVENNLTKKGSLKWLTVQDRYFMSAIIPKKEQPASIRFLLSPDNMLQTQYIAPTASIDPGTQQIYEFSLFFGPKHIKTLQKVGYELDKAINFGWFDFIAKPCLKFMNFLYGIIPNYGVVIIILTIIIKILFWPLGNKSYKSMNEMKKLQPLMAEIREKHKNDKKKMNEEIMGLYKIYKINPLGGCLPMLAQIPVFFALYRMLYESIELRHAPFFGWITDLSAPDRLFNFGFSIPFMQPPYGIPVLTIIMGATMLLQQKMQPPPGDPAQAKMMMLMPVVFTFIFINFSSGLVLYWLVNNILSIAQQYYISKKKA